MLWLVGLAWILGADSLALLVVLLWTGGLDVIELHLGDRSLLTWDAALCLAFFLQHSGWIVLGAALEERDLPAQFGEDYARYRRAVPMFIPCPRTRHGEERPKRAIAER